MSHTGEKHMVVFNLIFRMTFKEIFGKM